MPPCYWPAPVNFPGIDSVLVLEEDIFLFQLTTRAGHRSPIEGLKQLQKLLPSSLTKVPWRVVFIGADENRIKKVAEHWGNILFLLPKRPRVSVAWSVAHPGEDDNVTFKVRNLLIL